MEKRVKKSGGQEKYPSSLKIAIAIEWLKGVKSYGQLAEEYGLEKRSTVRHFVQWYQKHYPDQEVLISTELTPEEKSDNILVRKELSELQKKLDDANLKIASLNTTIDIAEKSLNLNIRKKSGSKQ